MITAETLKKYGWYCETGNRTIWYYDSWEYEFRINTQEMYYINDGMGEPQFIAKIESIENLIDVYEGLEGNNIKYEPMKLEN